MLKKNASRRKSGINFVLELWQDEQQRSAGQIALKIDTIVDPARGIAW